MTARINFDAKFLARAAFLASVVSKVKKNFALTFDSFPGAGAPPHSLSRSRAACVVDLHLRQQMPHCSDIKDVYL
jgi:hypothetical protein